MKASANQQAQPGIKKGERVTLENKHPLVLKLRSSREYWENNSKMPRFIKALTCTACRKQTSASVGLWVGALMRVCMFVEEEKTHLKEM